jgi:hypothetical protein
MKHVWSILCQTSIRDRDTNRTSAINAMDVIGFIVDKDKFEKNKMIPANLEIVSLWSNLKKDKKKFIVKIELIDSKKKVLNNSELTVGGEKDNSELNEARSVVTKMAISFLSVTSAGQYFFRVSQKHSNDKKFNIVAELPLEIKIKYQEKEIKK